MSAHIHASALNDVASVLQRHGWLLRLEPQIGSFRPDLIASRGQLSYVVEIKAISEARADRVIALLCQALVQAEAYARQAGLGLRPLAVVYVGDARASLFESVDRFARIYLSNAAIGVVSANGHSRFRGNDLHELSSDLPISLPGRRSRPRLASSLFSDLNQWMIKVLLAREIPEKLLSAPRSPIRNASELAIAADVSVMSASRFISRLREEHLLDLDPRLGSLSVVRRDEIFDRWKVVAPRPSPELEMCFVRPRQAQDQVRRIAAKHDACLGVFAAAEALGIGHVSGALPQLYVRRLPLSSANGWPELVPARQGERPDLILRRPQAPRSVFRGSVRIDGARVADVLQVWIDAHGHPGRGREQAEYIQQKVIPGVFRSGD